MKSPFTGGEVKLVVEPRTIKYRGKDYSYIHSCYECVDSGERFAPTEMDEVNYGQVYNQYRSENGIPFADNSSPVRSFRRGRTSG